MKYTRDSASDSPDKEKSKSSNSDSELNMSVIDAMSASDDEVEYEVFYNIRDIK